MKVRDLIHALTEEWIDQDSEVTIAFGAGEFESVVNVRTDQPWSVQRVFIETEPRDQGHWDSVWGMPEADDVGR